MSLKLTQQINLEKLRRYCAYQDRCHQEVRQKLLSLKMYGDDLEEIITELINEDFLNEERYAQSFARGKFRMKKWGLLHQKRHGRNRRGRVPRDSRWHPESSDGQTQCPRSDYR